MASISTFLNKSHIRKDGKSGIYLQLIVNREVFRIPLKLYWYPEQWKKNRAIGSSPEAKDINLIIQDNEAKANEILIRYRLTRREITIPLFEQEWKVGSPSKDFIQYMERKMKQRFREKEIGLSTYKSQVCTLNHLKAWKKALPFETLSERTAYQFDSYLSKNGNATNGRWSKHKNFKCYLNQAKSERIEFVHPYDYFTVRFQPSRFKPLHKEEVQRLWALYLKENLKQDQQESLRGFLFVCLTGMRHSDVRRFSMDWIDGDFLEFMPYKTRRFGTKVRIPTNNYILRLIMDELETAKPGKFFARICEQKQNEAVRLIGESLDLSTRLCYQVGRETFATLYMEHDGKLEVLASFMGHSTTKMSEKYVKIRDQRKKNEAQRIAGFLDN